jgi:TAG lipase/steryl ester hydrolase/phospholipase A2/LPA acyltransferase
MRQWKIIQLEKELLKIESFEEWNRITRALDQLDFNKRFWRENDESKFYDWKKIKAKRLLLNNLRISEDVEGLQAMLRQELQKNVHGICNLELYKVCHNGTKLNIESYHNEVI